jgi:aryl-alcohol dehydrogenase-like predicted oxidoreductase
VAENKRVSMTNIAIAWTLANGCLPIVGLNKVDRTEDAVAALSVHLSDEEMKFVEEPYTPKRVMCHT